MSQPHDPELDRQLSDVPLPAGFAERLRAALRPTEQELDERLRAVAVPEMLTTALKPIPADVAWEAELTNTPVPASLIASLHAIPWAVELQPQKRSAVRTAQRWIIAASLLLLIGGGYGLVSRVWFAEMLARFESAPPREDFLVYSGPMQLVSHSLAADSFSEEVLIYEANDCWTFENADRISSNSTVHSFAETQSSESELTIDPPSVSSLPSATRTTEALLLVAHNPQLLQNTAQLRWGVVGARHDDRDENLQLEELPALALQGVEPPISKGYSRPFWLKHHVLPPFSPTAAELQTFGLPLGGDAAAFDRAERLVAAGRKLQEHEIRVEDFVAHSLGVLPAAPSGTVQLRGSGGPSPFGPANSGMLHILAQAGEQRSSSPRHWVLAVDLSASMLRGGRWQGVQRLLRSLPERVSSEDRLSLIAFREEVVFAVEGLSPADASTWRAAVDKLKPSGGADLLVGVRESVALALEDREQALPPAQITLISDHEGKLTLQAVRTLVDMFGTAATAGTKVHLVDLASSAENSPLLQIAEETKHPRYSAAAGCEPAAALRQWWSAVATRVASDLSVEVKFDPKTVVAYRLLGHAAGSWSHVSSTTEKVELTAGEAVCSLVEIAFQPETPSTAIAAELTLRWREPQTGDLHQQQLKITKTEFTRPLHETPPAFQRAVFAAEIAEVLNGSRQSLRELNWTKNETHDLANALILLRQLPGAVRNDPATVRLSRLAESLRRSGVK